MEEGTYTETRQRWQWSSKLRVSTSIGGVTRVCAQTHEEQINMLGLLQEIWVVPDGVQLIAWSKAAEEVNSASVKTTNTSASI